MTPLLIAEVQVSVTEILKFATGLEEYPPMGLTAPVRIEFLSPSQVLPQASACFALMKLPLSPDKETFFKMMDTGIKGSLHHYGNI